MSRKELNKVIREMRHATDKKAAEAEERRRAVRKAVLRRRLLKG